MNSFIEVIAKHVDDYSDFAVLYPDVLAEGKFLQRLSPELIILQEIGKKICSIHGFREDEINDQKQVIRSFARQFLVEIRERPGYFAEETIPACSAKMHKQENAILYHLLEVDHASRIYYEIQRYIPEKFVPPWCLSFLPKQISENFNELLTALFMNLYGQDFRETIFRSD
jgi:hypothetical protein